MTSRGTATVTRPCSCETLKGTFSLASSTTRTLSPLADVLTVMRGTLTLPTSSVRCAARHSTFLRIRVGSRRGTESTGTSHRPPSSSTLEESRRRSPSMEARLL